MLDGLLFRFFQIEILNADFRDRLLLCQAQDLFEDLLVFRGNKRNRFAALARTARTTNAMHVIFRCIGKVEIHHVGNIVHVNAARQYVGAYNHVNLAALEIGQGALAFCLRAIGMDGGGANAGPVQATSARVGASACASEHDNARTALLFQKRNQQRGL